MNVDPSALPSLLLAERRHLPDAPGIYFVFRGEEVIYIGKARRLSERWKSTTHHRYAQLSTMGDVRLAWVTVEEEALLDELEAASILYFDPCLNRTPIETDGRLARYPLRLPAELLERVKEEAGRERRSINQMIEIALEEWLAARAARRDTPKPPA